MNLKCDWNEPEGDLCKDFLWCGPRLQSESFPDAVIVWSSITSGLRHPHLGQERSEEERCLTTLIVWRSHGCYLRCSPARNKSMDSACRARIRSGFAARDLFELTFYLLSAWHRLHCCPFSAQDSQSSKHNASFSLFLPSLLSFPFFSRFFRFFLQSWGSLRTKRGLKPLWNTPLLTIYNALSLLSLFLSLSLSLSLAFCLSPSSIFLSLSLYLSLSLFPSSSLCLSLSFSTFSLSFFISQSWGYPKNKPKRGLKPLWNTFLLTISGLLLHVFRTALAALSLSIYLFIYLSICSFFFGWPIYHPGYLCLSTRDINI